jgi:hypothetical protein
MLRIRNLKHNIEYAYAIFLFVFLVVDIVVLDL